MENNQLNQSTQNNQIDPIKIWKKINVKHFGLDFEKGAADKYEVSDHMEIRNKKTKRILVPYKGRVQICAGKTIKMLSLFPLVYYAFNKKDAPKTQEENKEYFVVLKNKDDDKHLDNLERLTRGDHARKIRARTKDTRKSVVCKRVKIIKVKKGFDQSLEGKEYESYTIAEIELGLPKGSVRTSCNQGSFAGGQFKFAYVIQELLQDEEFKEYKGIEVSNKGRVKLKDGKITRGTPIPDSKYHTVGVKLDGESESKRYYVHTLVWQAWNGRDVAKGNVICHNESTPEEKRLIDGYERNWKSDLREGTQRDNSQETQDNRTDLTPVLHENTNRWYHSGGKAAKALNLNPGNVHSVCKGKCTHSRGQHFRNANEGEKDVLYAAVANGTFNWGDVWVNPAESHDVIKDVINDIIDDVIKNVNQNETEELTEDVTDEDETNEYNKRNIEDKSIKIIKKVKK